MGMTMQLLGYADGDQCIRKTPAEPLDGLGDHFLHGLLRLCHVGHAAFVLDAGDGQQILHHVQEPVRVGVDVLSHFSALGAGEVFSMLHQRAAGAQDGG